jgi:16S rRNA (guanine(1405)-N(7))-methyltransferase
MNAVKQQIITDVRKKKEYLNLDDNFILKHLEEYFRLHPKTAEYLKDLPKERLTKNAKYKNTIKHIRAISRKIYGIFQKDVGKRNELLEKDDIKSLLLTHLSTKERIEVYPELYKKILKYTPLDSILDLACGLNPISIVYMPKLPSEYEAVDLSADDAKFLNRFFENKKIKGKSHAINLAVDFKKVQKLKSCHTAFLFKALDSLEAQNRNMTYEFLPLIPADVLIVSFTTVNVKQQPLTRPRRSWFEKVCNRIDFSFETFELGNEIFYVCKKV